MISKKVALLGGLFFTWLIVKKLHSFGLPYLTIDLFVLAIMGAGYIYKKLHWLFEEKK